MAKGMQKLFERIYNSFKDDTAKMLITTGVIGWILSSAAQVGAVLVNPKISNDKKSFLLAQESSDAAVNILSFFLITRATRRFVLALFKRGKFATSGVRDFLEKNKKIYGEKVGKLDFNLDDVALKDMPTNIKNEYFTGKNFATTIATVGAGIVASNIVTPIIRNKMAANFQKEYRKVVLNNPDNSEKKVTKPQIITYTSKPGSIKI